ncbi:GAD-like domain-containing protein [Gordonia sp. ABSL1-1]|uniref:GAD-like domain-containing protein n=1 Tax=Gordonia sp. ABSL1-1 TaxID=3053923 RepID=UPI00257395EF|nr:GAD-like domain-containing protein [Gordonia sp. ABSL1-1]MDL9937735.1 GAD-like domain-containing protein [Gordonia sp. ABSL1-1]
MVDLEEFVDAWVQDVSILWQGPFPADEHVNRFGDVLPEFVLALWSRVGFSGFGDGAMWLVDPLVWADAGAEMTRGVEVEFLEPGALLVPVARSAFGEMWFWSPGCGVCLSVAPATGEFHARRLPNADGDPETVAYVGFSSMKRAAMDIFDSDDEGLFSQALERLGPVSVDECYGFVPSLLFGVPPELGNIHKVKVREHLRVLDMIRRGEFTLETGPPVMPAEDEVSDGVNPVGGMGDSETVGRMVQALGELASESMPGWDAVVGTGVVDDVDDGLFDHAVVGYIGGEGQRIRTRGPGRAELTKPFVRAVAELRSAHGSGWEGVKVTVRRGGDVGAIQSFDRSEVVRWTTGFDESPSPEQLIELLRPADL